MNTKLIRKLVTSGVIRENTEIEAFYKGVDMTGCERARVRGSFFIRGLKVNDEAGVTIFSTVSTIDGRPRTVLSEDVISVDGMPVDRLASIYGLDATGGKMVQGKRRGRKPKNRAPEPVE